MLSSSLWPDYVRQRLHHTYAYLAGSLALTAGAGYAAAQTPAILRLTANGGLVAMIATFAVIIGTGMLVRSIDYNNTTLKHGAWALHCAAMGAVLAPLVFMGGPVLLRAAWYTAGIVGGLSATAMCAPSEKFLMMGGPLAMGLGVVFVANIGSLFFPPGTALGAGLASIVVYGGLILFSAFLLYDTQRVIKKAEITPAGGYQTFYNQYGQPVQTVVSGYDPINAQLSIYMDILNIFIRMVMILGGGNQRRK
uniref:Growth hormone-inducible transmembrane protein n=1 Tax=Panagrellus redivivus TaxID=6233 RepID=A0A7E4VL27_PANRE